MHYILCAVIFLVATTIGNCQISSRHIRTYGPEVTKAGTVINAVASDEDGVLFFGTEKGVLVYDGETWEIIKLPDEVGARSIDYDSIRHRIWVGGLHTFGYLSPDKETRYRYVSVSDSEYQRRPFSQVWGVLIGKDKVTFSVDEGLYVVQNDSVALVDSKNSYIFDVGGIEYVTCIKGALYILQGDSLRVLWDQAEITWEAVYQVVKLNKDNHLLITPFDGVFIHHLPTDRVTPYHSPLSQLLIKFPFYTSLQLSNGLLAIATYYDGILIADLEGNLIEQANVEDGLLANGIADLELDRFGKLWVATDYGISVIDLKAALPKLKLPSAGRHKTLITGLLVNRDSTIYILPNPTHVFFNRRPEQLSMTFATPGSEYLTSRQYLVRLDGYDTLWHATPNGGFATYNRLGNGAYTFRVKSQILGQEESSEASMSFTIQEPWYTLLIELGPYVIAGLGIVGLLIMTVTFRLRTSRNKLTRLVEDKIKEIKLRELELSIVNKDLMEANEELDTFLYRSSHDLIAPVKSIRGLLQLMRISKDDEGKYLQLMEDRIHRLEQILLEINSYVMNLKAPQALSRFRLRELVNEIWSELEFIEGAGNIAWRLEVQEGLILICDRNRWKMVLSNLIANAIKYHDPAKKNAYIRVAAKEEANGLHIMVEDNGQGIKTEYQTRLFDMFYRANENSTGTGLGLFLVKKVVEGLNGKIRVESNFSMGTKMEITMPAKVEYAVSDAPTV